MSAYLVVALSSTSLWFASYSCVRHWILCLPGLDGLSPALRARLFRTCPACHFFLKPPRLDEIEQEGMKNCVLRPPMGGTHLSMKRLAVVKSG